MEPTEEAIETARELRLHSTGLRSGDALDRHFGKGLDAFASRRVAEKDAEIDALRADWLKEQAVVKCEQQQAEIAALRRDKERLGGAAVALEQARANLDRMCTDRDATIAALRAQVEWRPIDQDAKNGVEILVYRADPLAQTIGIDKFNKYGQWTYSDNRHPPTHYMPLPAPPDHTIPSKGDAE